MPKAAASSTVRTGRKPWALRFRHHQPRIANPIIPPGMSASGRVR